MNQFYTLLTNLLKQRLLGFVLGTLLATGSAQAQSGNALNFDGVDDYVSLPASLTTGVTNFTFEAWLNYQDNGNWTRVMDFGTGTNVNMFLTPSNATNAAPRFAITKTGPGGEQLLTGTAVLSAGQHHLAVTLSKNGTSVTGTLYVDGAVANTNPNMNLTPSDLGALTQLYLGRSQYAGDPYLKGNLDEVRIYSTALTQAQVQADMKNSAGTSAVPASLLAYYNFNQGTASGNNPTVTTLVDGSGNARTGTLNNFALSGSTANWVGSVSTSTSGATPLPVELVAFTAQAEASAVRLQWTTGSEKNSARFEIERSQDGKQFTRVGLVAAQGTKTTPVAYVYQDDEVATFSGSLYYRLRQVDQDGTVSYSPVRTVQLAAAKAGAVVTLRGAIPGHAVQVLDALGRVAATATASTAGTAVLELPLGLTSGVYIVHTGTTALRLVVQ